MKRNAGIQEGAVAEPTVNIGLTAASRRARLTAVRRCHSQFAWTPVREPHSGRVGEGPPSRQPLSCHP